MNWPRVRESAGAIAAALVTAVSLVLDISPLFPGVPWQWLALLSFGVFVVLVWRLIHALHVRLDARQLKLDLAALREEGIAAIPRTQEQEPEQFAISLGNVRAWALRVEDRLRGDPDLLQHFTQGTPSAVALDAVVAQYGDKVNAPMGTALLGTSRIRTFVDVRVGRLEAIAESAG